MSYMNAQFNVSYTTGKAGKGARYHRITHASDPVPLLPLQEWGYTMHGEELFISAPSLPVAQDDVRHCAGDEDPTCIAGTDAEDDAGWGVPAKFKFWELFFAHRDYFWRLGLCVPGGDPKDWYRKYPRGPGDGEDEVEEL